METELAQLCGKPCHGNRERHREDWIPCRIWDDEYWSDHGALNSAAVVE